MPNLNPVPDTAEKLSEVYDLIQKDAVVKVLQYAPITEELRSEVLTNQKALKKRAPLHLRMMVLVSKRQERCT